MIEETWDQFVIYVNAYYAVQEAYDSARREWRKPAEGLKAFCRDANPFLWDGKASAEEALYEDFKRSFATRFDDTSCDPKEGFAFARDWLATLEGETFGTALVESFDQITNEREFSHACPLVARQLASRASHLERTPQDFPEQACEPAAHVPSEADIEAVIALIAKGDDSLAQELRARIASGDA